MFLRGELQKQLDVPQYELEGPEKQLGKPQSQLEGDHGQLEGPGPGSWPGLKESWESLGRRRGRW